MKRRRISCQLWVIMFHPQLMSPHTRASVGTLQRVMIKLTSRFHLPLMIHNKSFKANRAWSKRFIRSSEPTTDHYMNDRAAKIEKGRANPSYVAKTSQAEKMVKWSRLDLKAGGAGDNVAVSIPMVDRRRGDPQIFLI